MKIPVNIKQTIKMEFTAARIAELLEGSIEGNPDVVLCRIDKIETATSEALTFLANPVYLPYIYTTRAGAVLVKNDFKPEKPVGATLIRVKDPYMALARLLDLYNKHKKAPAGISPLAYVSVTAQIEDGAYIGPFAFVGERARIGKNAQIFPHCFLGDDVVVGSETILYSGVKVYHECRIGDECIIHANAVVGSDGFGFAPDGQQGFSKIAQLGNVVIQNHVEIGAGTTIDRATLGSTIIGQGVKLDNQIQVAHNAEIGSNTAIAAQTGIAGSAKIGSSCMIGGQVGVAGHIKIGNNVKIAAQSGIIATTPDGQTLVGSPALEHKQFFKSYVHFRNLHQIVKRLEQLESLLQQAPGEKNSEA